MEIQDNPYIQPENYFKEYNKSIEELKNNPKALAFDKMCYELFESELGKKFIEVITERYLIPTLVSKGNPTYQIDVLWQEGFKDFPRMVMACTKSHKDRIEAQGHKS
jgi:hypothetical protein